MSTFYFSDLFLDFSQILVSEFQSIFDDAITQRHNRLYCISDWLVVTLNQVTHLLDQVLFEPVGNEEKVMCFHHVSSESLGFKRCRFAFLENQLRESFVDEILGFLVNCDINRNHDVFLL